MQAAEEGKTRKEEITKRKTENLNSRKPESQKKYIEILKNKQGYYFSPVNNSGYPDYIFMMIIENDFPIVKKIDMVNKEIIVKESIILDKVHHNIEYDEKTDGFVNYFFDFRGANTVIRFLDDEFQTFRYGDKNIIFSYYDGWWLDCKFVGYSDKPIPLEVIALTSDYQKPYSGKFKLINYGIVNLKEEGLDIKLPELWKEQNNISSILDITFNDNGFLSGKGIHELINREYNFKVLSDGKTILDITIDGTIHQGSIKWFYKDFNTIRYEKTEIVIDEYQGGDGSAHRTFAEYIRE